MMEKIVNKSSYVSCIKINGVPILPPLITPALRLKLLEYKQQAKGIEEKLQHARKAKELQKPEETFLEASTQADETVEESNSHIDALDIQKETSFKYVPYLEDKLNQPHLTTELVDNTEYSDSGMKILDDNVNSDTDFLCTSTAEINLDKSFDLGDEANSYIQTDGNSLAPPVPRLIRSNSYVLDTPSPILLAHLEKQNSNLIEGKKLFASDFSTSSELDFSEKCPRSELNYRQSDIFAANTENEDLDNEHSLLDRVEFLPTLELVTTDISVQEINIRTTLDTEVHNLNNIIKLFTENNAANPDIDVEIAQNKTESRNTDPETELNELLEKLPGHYSKKITELIEKQKVEQQKRLKHYEELKDKLLNESGPEGDSLKFDVVRRINVEKSNPYTFDSNTSSTHSLFHSPSTLSFDTAAKSTRIQSEHHKMLEITENDLKNAEVLSTSSSDSVYSQSMDTSVENLKLPIVSLNTEKILVPAQEKTLNIADLDLFNSIKFQTCGPTRTTNAHRKLFSEEEYILKQDWAATKIGAAIKGYLVRRLLKTDKVQGLIQTIKDALLCAIDLHRSDNIEESDIELHRRLIQQVSAACFAFHDVFFQLTTKDQLQIIAMDREHKKQKALRPLSSRSSISEFRATPKQKMAPTTNRLTKSLTKV